MNDFGGGFGGGPSGGFDWNGNGHRDTFDGYMDYKLSGSDKGGGNGSGNGGSGGGDGCFSTIGAIAIILLFLYILGSCS